MPSRRVQCPAAPKRTAPAGTTVTTAGVLPLIFPLRRSKAKPGEVTTTIDESDGRGADPPFPVTFEVLGRERHVPRAAHALGVGQAGTPQHEHDRAEQWWQTFVRDGLHG